MFTKHLRPSARLPSTRLLHTTRAVRSDRETQTKKEGTIASVFASLSGAGDNILPTRFCDLKQEMVGGKKHADSMLKSWREVLQALQPEVDHIVKTGPAVIPTVQYPGAHKPLEQWMDAATLAEIRRRGVVIIKGVVSKEQALGWKKAIQDYVKANPEVRGESWQLWLSASALTFPL